MHYSHDSPADYPEFGHSFTEYICPQPDNDAQKGPSLEHKTSRPLRRNSEILVTQSRSAFLIVLVSAETQQPLNSYNCTLYFVEALASWLYDTAKALCQPAFWWWSSWQHHITTDDNDIMWLTLEMWRYRGEPATRCSVESWSTRFHSEIHSRRRSIMEYDRSYCCRVRSTNIR